MGNFICPYCFTENDEKKIEYRCSNRYCITEYTDKDGKRKSSDLIYEEYWKTEKATTTLIGAPRKSGTVKCDKCKEKTNNRICPTCHSDLPYTFGSFQDETFSVIGMKESGKTHFIAMLIKTFGKKVSEKFNVSMEIVHDEVSKKFKEVYDNNLKDKSVINETNSGDSNIEVRRPLVYKLAFRKKGFLGKKKLDIATLSLFDNAGEDLFFEDRIRNINKCIFNSTGIILIIDPLQLPHVHEELKIRGITLPKMHGDTKEMLSRVAKVIREKNNIAEDQLINTPIAIALSKSDVLKEIIGEGGSMMFQESRHYAYLSKDEIVSISNEVESFIREWDDTGLLTQIKNNFSNYCFFGFTALGSNPENGQIHRFRPMRVEDPFLWLLHKRNLIDMK